MEKQNMNLNHDFYQICDKNISSQTSYSSCSAFFRHIIYSIYQSFQQTQYIIYLLDKEMSRFRGQTSRSPYRTPPRLYETERDALIEEQIRLKSALKAEADNRRIHDEMAILQAKTRHTAELEDRCEMLYRQNTQLARDNEELSRLLSEKKYENERIRAASADQNQRDAIKNGQLYEANKSLELEIELLKKERIQSNRLYETHIDKLERMLDEKVVELDSVTLKCSDLSKELELAGIRFEQERNRMKNLMTRTEHELERELEYTKQKSTTEKFSEIDSMKRNHAAQVAILEEEIGKLKILNNAKTEDFENQLSQNRVLRKRHEDEMRSLANENDELRVRLLKLEEMNRSEVENINIKYNNYHNEGTNSLKEQHAREIRLLLDEIDKLKWIISEKNAEIQNQVHEKKELRKFLDETQLELSSDIENLKNKLHSQEIKFSEENQAHMERINSLCNQLERESDSYHSRVKDFKKKINNLQAEVEDKQSTIEKIKGEFKAREKELERALFETFSALQKVKRQLEDSEEERKGQNDRYNEYKEQAQQKIASISKELNETAVKLEQTQNRIERLAENSKGSEDLLKIENDTLKENVRVLEEKLTDEQKRHNNEMTDLSANLNEKVKALQAAQRKALDELEMSKKEQIDILEDRVGKMKRDKSDAEEELRRYIEMYNGLQKYFKSPHDGALFEERSKNSIYEVLSRVSTSSIHIF